jgi:hypothetical protein
VRDLALINTAGFLRSFGVGLTGVVLGIYLSRLGHSSLEIGIVIAAGLAGSAFATVVMSLVADRMGRRRFLVLCAAICCPFSLLISCLRRSNYWLPKMPARKSGLFVSDVSAMICLRSRFRYCSRFKMLLSSNRWSASYYSRTARGSQTSQRLEVSSRPTTWAHSHLARRLRPPQASLHKQIPHHNSVSLMRVGRALHDNQQRISQCLCM